MRPKRKFRQLITASDKDKTNMYKKNQNQTLDQKLNKHLFFVFVTKLLIVDEERLQADYFFLFLICFSNFITFTDHL